MRRKNQTGLSPRRPGGAWTLLIAGLIVSTLAAWRIKTGVERSEQREFELNCDLVGRRIGHRLDAASLILRSAAAFLDGLEKVTREDWRAFIRRLEMERHTPGIQGVGFAPAIPREERARHVQTIRDEGFPDYQIFPPGERESYSAIIYLEPFSDRNRRAFGYDMLAEPVRRAAMEKARDENAAALSGKVVLMQETGQDVQPGALLYFPVYRRGAPSETLEQRRAAIRGWVYSPYRMTDLIHGTLEEWEEHPRSSGISLLIDDGDDRSANGLLYRHLGAGTRAPGSAARYSRVIPIDFAGHRWTLRFTHPGRSASPAEQGMAWLVFLGGLLVNLLLFGLMRSRIHLRDGAWELREEIAERKRADEEAQKAAVYLDTMPDTLMVAAPDNRIITVNQAFSALWGYTADEAVGKPVSDFFPEDEWPTHRDEMEKATTQRTTRDFESRILTKSGNLVPVALSGKAVLDESGRVVALVAVIRDITERKRAEAEREKMLASARESRRALLSVLDDEKRTAAERTRLATTIEQSAESMMITDARGSIVYVNPAFETTSGHSRADVFGQNPRILQSGKHDAAFYREMWATLTAGRVWRGHFSNKRKDGTHYEEDATLSPVRDSAGKIVNYVAVKRDMTREVELEAQLRQAQKMESIGRLAGGVAHDFNNLIMGVMGYTELARDKLPPNHPVCEDLNEIMGGARRTAALTKQLLAFARKQNVMPQELDLNAAIAHMLNMLRQLIGEDVNLAWMPGAALWKVKMDPSQIDQILANLCVNARDAISGVGNITIETANGTVDESFCARQPDAVPGDYVLCIVSDDGCGMTKDVQEKIFEPFYTSKGLGEGTGLGLSTVYGIVRQNNGFIHVYSEPGKGTTFRIYLPRLDDAPPQETVHAEPLESRGGKETILLVEDEASVRAIAARFLEQLGYGVLTAGAPDEAIRVVERHEGSIDMVITDVVMPGMNGRDLAMKLAESRPALKTLYISGYTASIISQRGVLEKDVHFLSKPFTREALARKTREVLESD